MAGSTNLRLRIRPDRAAAIAVSLAPLLYFFPALLQGKALSAPSDGLLQKILFRDGAQMTRSGWWFKSCQTSGHIQAMTMMVSYRGEFCVAWWTAKKSSLLHVEA